MSTLASFLLLIVVSCSVNCGVIDNEVHDRFMGVDLYGIDRDCAMVGGLCVHKDDCVVGTSKQGLCPTNAHRGVECCYELAVRPAPCREHLGICMPRCGRALQRPATDCTNGDVCCVLIRR